MNACGISMSQEQLDIRLGAWKRFLSLTEDVQEVQMPKRHAMAHIILATLYQGHPRFYAGWVDESLNKDLKAACRKVSQNTFDEMVLLAMSEFMARGRTRGAVDM